MLVQLEGGQPGGRDPGQGVAGAGQLGAEQRAQGVGGAQQRRHGRQRGPGQQRGQGGHEGGGGGGLAQVQRGRRGRGGGGGGSQHVRDEEGGLLVDLVSGGHPAVSIGQCPPGHWTLHWAQRGHTRIIIL